MRWNTLHIDILLVPVTIIMLVSGCKNKEAQVPNSTKEPVIECAGIVSASENKILVSAPIDGKITWVTEAMTGDTRTMIARIENPSFITLQKDYLEARNLYEYYKEEYTRQGELTVENATSIKKMQVAKKDYQSAEINLRALEMQLRILGLDPDSMIPEKIFKSLPVYSIKKGRFSGKFVKAGDYVSMGNPLIEITENETLLIKFQIPEQEYLTIKAGHRLDCRPASDTSVVYKAYVKNLAAQIDPETHMATGFAELKENNHFLIPGMTVKCMIYPYVSDSTLRPETSN